MKNDNEIYKNVYEYNLSKNEFLISVDEVYDSSKKKKDNRRFYNRLKKRKRKIKYIFAILAVYELVNIFFDTQHIHTVYTTIEYKVVSGDTLWSIAQEYLGDSKQYWRIAYENEISNPDLIYPNDVIFINIKEKIIIEE